MKRSGLILDLQAAIGRSWVLHAPEDLLVYEYDATIDRGLPEVLAAYLDSIHPRLVVDLLSLEYRQSVIGYAAGLKGIDVRTIDFPGMGRASQPLRGERIARILQSGTA